jgi:hypothetical protein
MARQEEVCWHCGAAYAPALRPVALVTAADRWDDDGGHAAPSQPEPLVAAV